MLSPSSPSDLAAPSHLSRWLHHSRILSAGTCATAAGLEQALFDAGHAPCPHAAQGLRGGTAAGASATVTSTTGEPLRLFLRCAPPGLTVARHRRHRSSRGTARKPRLHSHGGAQIDTSHGGSTSSALELARYGPAATVCHGEAQIDSGGNRPPVSRPSTSLSVVPLLQEAKCASRSSQFLAILRSKF